MQTLTAMTLQVFQKDDRNSNLVDRHCSNIGVDNIAFPIVAHHPVSDSRRHEMMAMRMNTTGKQQQQKLVVRTVRLGSLV